MMSVLLSKPEVGSDSSASDSSTENLTHVDLKVAAAAGAQAVAAQSQKVADELQKKADKAVEKEHPSEGTLDRLRDLAHRTTEEVIQLLKDLNSPKE